MPRSPKSAKGDAVPAAERDKARQTILRLTAPKIPEPLENAEQETLLYLCALHAARYPELKDLFHIPNGGWRSKATGAALKRQGVKPGVPDLFLPHGRDGYLGLFIELKRLKEGGTSTEQEAWVALLNHAGYRAVVCRGADAALAELLSYLSKPQTTVRHPRI